MWDAESDEGQIECTLNKYLNELSSFMKPAMLNIIAIFILTNQ